MSQQPTQTAQTPADGETLGRDMSFHLLESQRRRWAIRYLNHERSAELADLAEQVAAWENETTVDQITSEQRRRAYTSLQQVHLPKLHDSGVVDFDVDRGTVKATDRVEDLDVYLEVVRERDIPWSTYYLGVGVLSCVLVGVVAVIDVGVLEAVPDLGWAAAIGLTLTVSAAVHTYRSRSMRVDSGGTLSEGKRP